MKPFRCIAVLFVVTVFLGHSAQATDARSESLLYNLTFEDQTDVFFFPQLLPKYEGVYFHLPPAISNVFGGAIIGWDDSAVGFFVHRPLTSAFDQYRIGVLGGVAAPGGILGGNPGFPVEAHIPGQIFDLIYGAKTWGLSFRTHFWSDVSVQQGLLADPPEASSVFSTEVNAGFEVSPGMHMRASLGFRHEAIDPDPNEHIAFRAALRYIDPQKKRIRLVLGTELQLGVFAPGGGDTAIGFALPFKAGIRLEAFPDHLYIGVLGGLDLQMISPGGDADVLFGMAIPTLEIAAEWFALSWLEVRSAIKGGYGIQFAGDPAENTPKYEQMTFSSGLGFPLGAFRLDAVVQYGLWQNGPYLIGGNAGLFAGVTLAFCWGEGIAAPSAEPDDTSSGWTSDKPKKAESPPAAAPAEPAAAAPAPVAATPAPTPATTPVEPDPEPEPEVTTPAEPVELLPPRLNPMTDPGDVPKPGVTTSGQIIDEFGMPPDMKKQGDGMLFSYADPYLFPGTRKVSFLFDAKDKLKRVDFFPEAKIQKTQVIATLGKGFFVREKGKHKMMIYKRAGLIVFIRKGNNTVYSYRLTRRP